MCISISTYKTSLSKTQAELTEITEKIGHLTKQ